MTLRKIFHSIATTLVVAWLASEHRENPEVKYVFAADLFVDGTFPDLPDGSCVKITLEVVPDVRKNKTQYVDTAIPVPHITEQSSVLLS